ncbi:hypothetical protein PYW07_016537 [Mythimna separata]|uniref:Gag protein n=1 Tax=Mythimna separata TaxID=271217 RepID=A0AAD8DRN2_MYTSE|nr:hypothetical protein PYW07_016537 [Mythimna separata]
MDVKVARQNFKIRAKMLRDFHSSVEATASSIAVKVIKRQFDKYYIDFLQAYEELVASGVDDIEDLGHEFSAINSLLVSVETKAEESEVGSSPLVKPKIPASGSQDGGSLAAKLPFIQLGRFDGNPMDWVSFYDLFLSLVHDRPNLPETEKHYYLRSCLSGEPLTLVKHLPVDAKNYEVALGLLRDRYQNTRLLADTYLEQIVSLPNISSTMEGLRQSFYNPLLESTQALQKLGLPIAEWSYLLFFIVLQKLPSRLRNQFEERNGTAPGELPSFSALMSFLDEVCRRQLVASSSMEQERAKSSRPQKSPTNTPRRSTTSTGGRHPPPSNRIRGQVTTAAVEVRCIYCNHNGHSIAKCYEFKRLDRTARKTWTRNNGACFVCLGQHYARECAEGTGCNLCGSEHHHTLLCTAAGETTRPTTQQAPRQTSRHPTPQARTPLPQRAKTPPRRSSLMESNRPSTSQRRDPGQEQPQSHTLEQGRRPVGNRYQQQQTQDEVWPTVFIPKRDRNEDDY